MQMNREKQPHSLTASAWVTSSRLVRTGSSAFGEGSDDSDRASKSEHSSWSRWKLKKKTREKINRGTHRSLWTECMYIKNSGSNTRQKVHFKSNTWGWRFELLYLSDCDEFIERYNGCRTTLLAQHGLGQSNCTNETIHSKPDSSSNKFTPLITSRWKESLIFSRIAALMRRGGCHGTYKTLNYSWLASCVGFPRASYTVKVLLLFK